MQTFNEIFAGFLTSQYAIVFCASAMRLGDAVEGLCAPAGTHKPSTASLTRLACEPGLVQKQHLRGTLI